MLNGLGLSFSENSLIMTYLRPFEPLDAVVSVEQSVQASRSHYVHLRGE